MTDYPDYSLKTYWENRYKEEMGATTDWLVSYEQIKSLVHDKIPDK